MEILECQEQRENLEGVCTNGNGILEKLTFYVAEQDLVQRAIPSKGRS